MDSFTVKSVIRGYHIYEEVCMVKCNSRSAGFVAVTHETPWSFAVATCKGMTVVGRMPYLDRYLRFVSYIFFSGMAWG